MKNYNPPAPRVASGLAAIAMVGVTMGVLVVLPAKFDSLSEEPYTLAAARAATMAMTGAPSPARVDGLDMDGAKHPATDCAAVGAQASRGKSHKLISRSQTST